MAEAKKKPQRTEPASNENDRSEEENERQDAPVLHSERAQHEASRGSTAVTEDEGGATIIHDLVVAKIAQRAAKEVRGVYRLVAQGTGQRIASMARSATGSEDRESGVAVEVGTEEVAVDVRLEVEYGTSIPQIADAIRRNISERVESMTGLHAVEINIEVVDLHFDEDDAPPQAASEGDGATKGTRVR